MKTKPFTDRLDGLGFAEVGGPIEWAGLTSVPRLPGAFFVPGREQAGPNTLGDTIGAVDQRVDYNFSVFIVLQGAARLTGKIDEKLTDTIAAVKSRFRGWTHPEAVATTSYAGGEMYRIDGVVLIWAVRFSTAYRDRKVG